jgi:hypothetical protein
MAQTGFTPIQIYSSNTAAAAPVAGNLTNSTLGSELAINITDGKLFYKDNANAIQVIAWKVTPTTAGGTGLTSYTAGDLVYYASGTTFTKLAIGASGRYLSSTGTAPQWSAPGALTETDDTNVTMTLGGSPSTALLNAVSMTLGWTGTLAVSRGGTGTGTAGITAFNNITGYTASGATGTTSTNLVFSTSPSITTPTLVGDVTLSTGNLVVSNGKGIDFSATPGTGTSELFDDYEEGTFTPTLQGATTTTYTTQTGRYTIIGRQVFFQCEIQINSLGNGSNNTFILNGLPTNSSEFSTIAVGFFANIATAVVSLFGYINANATSVTMQNLTAANASSGTAATFGNGARIIVSGQYSI